MIKIYIQAMKKLQPKKLKVQALKLVQPFNNSKFFIKKKIKKTNTNKINNNYKKKNFIFTIKVNIIKLNKPKKQK